MSKVIVIVGLPGSGKSTYAKTHYNEYVIFDDFITTFCNGEIIKNIKLNNNVCIIDPRLCDVNIFNRCLDKILKYVDVKNIKLILFENNKELCQINVNRRNDNRNVNNTICNYSKIYFIDNYGGYDRIVIPCWNGNSVEII